MLPPNVVCANLVLCERVLNEAENVVSAIRVADLYVTKIRPGLPLEDQQVRVNVLGQIKMADTDQTEHTLELDLIRPNGEVVVVGPPTTGPAKTRFPEIPGGYILVADLSIIPSQFGIHFFSLLMDGNEIARSPFILLDHTPNVS